MIRYLINLIYPAFCQLCGKKTVLQEGYLCPDCLKKIKKRVPPFCRTCGKQLLDTQMQKICIDCEESSFYFDRASSALYYNEPLKKLVHNFKYKKMTSLTKEFVALTMDFMERYGIGKNAHLILSIPMHPARLFKREINPSHILAKNIAKKLGCLYSEKLLKKTKNTKLQTKLNRQERIDNLKGSFYLHQNTKYNLRHKNILLVDDIFTTGSTVNECAKILKEKGATYVEVVTLARGDKLP